MTYSHGTWPRSLFDVKNPCLPRYRCVPICPAPARTTSHHPFFSQRRFLRTHARTRVWLGWPLAALAHVAASVGDQHEYLLGFIFSRSRFWTPPQNSQGTGKREAGRSVAKEEAVQTRAQGKSAKTRTWPLRLPLFCVSSHADRYDQTLQQVGTLHY
jgi:hypothetical protein